MKKYAIFYPVGGVINHFCKRGLHEYEQIGVIEATDLENAFFRSQNDFADESFHNLKKRSSCVGDIFKDLETNTLHMVMGIGFQEVPFTVLQYLDWGNHMDINELQHKYAESAAVLPDGPMKD